MPQVPFTVNVYAGHDLIGMAEIFGIDTGVCVGTFHQASGYDRVRAVFRMFAAQLEQPDHEVVQRYYAARDDLDLRVVDAGGAKVEGVVHITDLGPELGELQIEIYPLRRGVARRRCIETG